MNASERSFPFGNIPRHFRREVGLTAASGRTLYMRLTSELPSVSVAVTRTNAVPSGSKSCFPVPQKNHSVPFSLFSQEKERDSPGKASPSAVRRAPGDGTPRMRTGPGRGKLFPLMMTFSMTGSCQFICRSSRCVPSMRILRRTSPVIGTSGKASRKIP